jgi:hypothetical protein
MDLQDVTIDTNVLMHCDNPTEPRRDASRDFVLAFISSETKLCVDEGFDLDESRNTSHIGHEYLTHLVFGNIGYIAVSEAAKNKRIVFLKKDAAPATQRTINRLVSDKGDRHFVRVAMNSVSKVLVSHDRRAFDAAKKELQKSVGVTVSTASEVA